MYYCVPFLQYNSSNLHAYVHYILWSYRQHCIEDELHHDSNYNIYLTLAYFVENTGSRKLEHQIQDTSEMEHKSLRDTLLRDDSQDREEDSHTQEDSQQAIMRYDDAPPPYPCSSNDLHSRTECFEPVATQSQSTQMSEASAARGKSLTRY